MIGFITSHACVAGEKLMRKNLDRGGGGITLTTICNFPGQTKKTSKA